MVLIVVVVVLVVVVVVVVFVVVVVVVVVFVVVIVIVVVVVVVVLVIVVQLDILGDHCWFLSSSELSQLTDLHTNLECKKYFDFSVGKFASQSGQN